MLMPLASLALHPVRDPASDVKIPAPRGFVDILLQANNDRYVLRSLLPAQISSCYQASGCCFSVQDHQPPPSVQSMTLVTGAIGSLLPKLVDLLKKEYGLQKGVREKIESLSLELEVSKALLCKVGEVPWDQVNELVRLWARDIREASYDMEDIVDEFLVHIDAPEPTEPHMLRRLRKKMGKLFKKSMARRKISTMIQEIDNKLKEVEARHKRYTVHNIPDKQVAATTTTDPRLNHLYNMAAELIGIEQPMVDLINKLSLGGDGDHEKRKVVSVVGSGGLGKTTLAKAVYNQLSSRFDCMAFVPVGQSPDVKKVIRDILIGLDDEKYMYYKLNGLDAYQLMCKLEKFVKEKRCFIVIDDIWDKEPWKLIRCALRGSHCESRFVVTTRISDVAAFAGEAYKMQPLSYDNSEKLLYARIVDGEGRYLDSPSAKACSKILHKCDGVPLAIITIASLLASKPREDWSEIYNSIGFGQEDNGDVDNTRRILSYSYYDLPQHLKSCLLYLGVFPEDHMIEKSSLIWKWIAEGLVSDEEQAEARVGLFELGEQYFNELLNRSMIQPDSIGSTYYTDSCTVHDMVLDLIHSLSGDGKFITVLDGGDRQQKLGKGSIARRLALRRVEVRNGGMLANINIDKVRSIVASQCKFRASWPRIPVLRVLAMVDSYVEEDSGKGVLDHLGSLVHLRYLSLDHTTITNLPREVRYLKFLQTLDLWGSDGIEELPEEVGLLKQLVCLRVNSYRTRTPTGVIGKLTSLQELWVFPTSAAAMQFVKELGLLRELRVLWSAIDVTDEIMERALLESLGNLHNIRELHIQGKSCHDKGGCGTSDSAESVSGQNLRYVRLHCFVFSGLPAWIHWSRAPTLSYLELYVLAVKDEDMETLARLPELCYLNLHSRGKRFVTIKIPTGGGVSCFRKLRCLVIFGFDLHITESSNKYTLMPSLEVLSSDVHVRSRLGFHKLLGLDNLGRTSLRKVAVSAFCGGARASELDGAGAALANAAAAHPNHPTLDIDWKEEDFVLSPYQEVCIYMSRNPRLVNIAWKKFANIVSSGHIRAQRMPDPEAPSSKVIRLLYTNKGEGLLSLSSNAVHNLWKWWSSDKNPRGKCTTSVPPHLWQAEDDVLMENDIANDNPEEATSCIALSRDDHYLISASGGRISVFNMRTFHVCLSAPNPKAVTFIFPHSSKTTFMPPPPAATFLALYPQNNNIVAIGMEDSSILIYNTYTKKVEMVLMGHEKKITGLSFSLSMNVLVSSGADVKLCVWSMMDWKKKKSRYIQRPSNRYGALAGDTTVQFHYDQAHLLVVHESQLAIYDWKLECFCLWSPGDALPAPISSAVFSCDGLLIYAGFCDGSIGVFEARSLTLQCRIAPSAYISSSVSRGGGTVYPVAVAANPWKHYQMAVGMSDGAVYVLEPPLDTH
ncbi:hypothetical protein U9M48_042145 [Paspalum notatum var. saurae]|uniref:Uncharacterized protein n=1 Tax=Paspalum notatum var. saurae TaxID=547442 RepID=A0AAQ3UUI1_PASNO